MGLTDRSLFLELRLLDRFDDRSTLLDQNRTPEFACAVEASDAAGGAGELVIDLCCEGHFRRVSTVSVQGL
jgi:hypothetical protein